jgi:hypothetical protein
MQAVSDNLKETLTKLFEIKELESFYLAGGTNLALKYEHRVSTDIDLFCLPNVNINLENDILPMIENKFSSFIKESISKNILRLEINTIKVDFLNFYEIKKIINTPLKLNNWTLADTIDVAAMKISAILNRGSRKDFIDLAYLLKKHSLNEIINAYKLKYNINSDQQIIKLLIDFHEADIEGERSIKMINFNESWESIKKIIEIHLEKYLKQT